MTRDDFETWWRHHIAVAFPNVKSWLSNQCSCTGGHDKENQGCPSTQIKNSWFAVLACCELDDATAATDECQRTVEFQSVTPQQHPAEVRSVALHLAASRKPIVGAEGLVPLAEATKDEIANVRGHIRHAKRTLIECNRMRAEAIAAGFGKLDQEEQRYWYDRLADVVRSVDKSGSAEDYANRVIDGSRAIYDDLRESMKPTAGGVLDADPPLLANEEAPPDG